VNDPVTVEHELRLGGLDSPLALWAGPTATVGGTAVAVVGGRSTAADGWLRTQVDAVPGRWNGFAVAVGGNAPADAEEMRWRRRWRRLRATSSG